MSTHPSHQCACGSGLHESDCNCSIIEQMKEKGYSNSAIAHKMGLPENSVRIILKRVDQMRGRR